MKRSLLSVFFLASLGANAQVASPFTFYVHDTTGKQPDILLPATYQLAGTAVGNASPTVLKMVNTSQTTAYFVIALMATAADSLTRNPNFSITGLFEDEALAPGASVLFTVNFTPSTMGAISGFLNIVFQIQEGGCLFTSTNPSQQCPSNTVNVSTFNGTATPPQLILSYQSPSGSTVLQPSSSSPLRFPDTSLSATSTYTFTLTNTTSVDLTAAISLPTVNQNAAGAFDLDESAVPSVIAAGQSANFNVTFAPSQLGLANGVLQVGSNSYPIAGEGIVVTSIDALQISYTDSTGVRTLPQAATPISFGQVIPGSGASAVLAFSVTNPSTSLDAVPLSGITVRGSAFALSNVPAAPIIVAPGNTVTFKASFTPASTGTFTGSLAIGSRQFSLNGVSVASSIPGFSLTLGAPLTSQQQATVTVQLSAVSPVSAIGTMTMQFAPSVANVADDPAIAFLATGGRQLNLVLNSGSQAATYNGQSAIAFQTGTTAGAITFSVAFPDTATYTQSFTITPATIQIAAAHAARESPNLLVTVTGYDNTFSAGELSFTFYDTAGKAIGGPIPFNAASDFQQLFFTNNTAGGVFSLQASFPVLGSGDVTQVGSVTVGMSNSLGLSTASATFQ